LNYSSPYVIQLKFSHRLFEMAGKLETCFSSNIIINKAASHIL